MHVIDAHARFDDLELDLDFENVCIACPCLKYGVNMALYKLTLTDHAYNNSKL